MEETTILPRGLSGSEEIRRRRAARWGRRCFLANGRWRSADVDDTTLTNQSERERRKGLGDFESSLRSSANCLQRLRSDEPNKSNSARWSFALLGFRCSYCSILGGGSRLRLGDRAAQAAAIYEEELDVRIMPNRKETAPRRTQLWQSPAHARREVEDDHGQIDIQQT
jgi:hypothetical protein